MPDTKRIAIVYDWLDKWGGVERILMHIHHLLPEATFFTSYYDPKRAEWAQPIAKRTSFIQKLPRFIKRNRILSLPFYPYAFESFDFRGYDTVLSVTSSFAKSIITHPDVFHVCYLLTPTRYLWNASHLYQSRLTQSIGKGFISYLKQWDRIAATRPDKIISISETVAKRCKYYYQRESDVLYPPFDANYWLSQQKEKSPVAKPFFLVVSRLESYKRVDIPVELFTKQNDKTLVVIGSGNEKRKLQRMAGKNIRFIEHISDRQLASFYQNAEALVMPQEEDFGYVALEAQTMGCPVIAYEKGGAQETVLKEKTGIFFPFQTVDSLASALERFHTISYNLKAEIRNNGIVATARFRPDKFIAGLKQILYKKI